MRLKKLFSSDTLQQQNGENPTLYFNSEPVTSAPMTRAMKKLIHHKNAGQLAINVLCDLSKEHCAMCEWEQECSDNPLLFDPVYTRRKKRKTLLVHQQTVNVCKVQIKTGGASASSSNATRSSCKCT
jgi:hypothetical protein